MARTYFDWNEKELKERITIIKGYLTTLTGLKWPVEEVNVPEESEDEEASEGEALAEDVKDPDVAEEVADVNIELEIEDPTKQADRSIPLVQMAPSAGQVDTDDIDTVDSVFEGSADELGSEYSRAKLEANIEKVKAKLIALGVDVPNRPGRLKGWKKAKDGRVKEGRITKKARKRGKKVARGDEDDELGVF